MKVLIENRTVNIKTKTNFFHTHTDISTDMRELTCMLLYTYNIYVHAHVHCDFATIRLLCKTVARLHQVSLLLIDTANVPASQLSTLCVPMLGDGV